MRLKCVLAITGLVLASLGLGSHALAQADPAAPPADPATPSAEPATPSAEPAVPPDEPDGDTKKGYFGLYVEAAIGVGDADDIATGVKTLSTQIAESYLTFEDQRYSRAAIGWKLQHGKGDFRLRFDGFREDGYKFESQGRLAAVDPDLALENPVSANLLWWTINAENGEFHATRTPPQWDAALDDANNNETIDPEEVRYEFADVDIDAQVTRDLQNRAQTYDLLYGRTFGKRTFSARWWAGARYFAYDGNLQASAWLLTIPTGEGFTDGALLPIINFSQSSRGLGPTGALEADFNFFEQRLQIYVQAQVAFMMTKVETDSGLFSTLVATQGGTHLLPAEARLTASRNKSTWQDGAEVGLRYSFRNGLQLEACYYAFGYLDVILLPNEFRIPQNILEVPQGTSALYKTQDYVLQGWRAGVGFQF